MPRIAIIISLFVSLGLFVRGGALLWKEEPLPELRTTKKEKVQAAPREQGTVIFFPQVSPQPPNLRDGYLFNESRLIAEETPEEPIAEEPPPEEAPSLDIEGLEFVGSIITEKVRKAMVLYQPIEEPPQEQAAPPQPPPRGGRQPFRGGGAVPGMRGAMPPMKPPGGLPKGEKKYATLTEGEEFEGFTVLGVFPDKLVMEKGGSRYEKTLYEPGRQREGGGAGVPPAAQGGGEPRSRTIGGGAGGVPGQPGAAPVMPGGLRGGQQPMTGGLPMQGRLPQAQGGLGGHPGMAPGVGAVPPPQPVPAPVPMPAPQAVGQAPAPGNFPKPVQPGQGASRALQPRVIQQGRPQQ